MCVCVCVCVYKYITISYRFSLICGHFYCSRLLLKVFKKFVLNFVKRLRYTVLVAFYIDSAATTYLTHLRELLYLNGN